MALRELQGGEEKEQVTKGAEKLRIIRESNTFSQDNVVLNSVQGIEKMEYLPKRLSYGRIECFLDV